MSTHSLKVKDVDFSALLELKAQLLQIQKKDVALGEVVGFACRFTFYALTKAGLGVRLISMLTQQEREEFERIIAKVQ